MVEIKPQKEVSYTWEYRFGTDIETTGIRTSKQRGNSNKKERI